jgi:PKD repeat protein
MFDTVYFYNYSYDPAGQGFKSWAWTFGDGSTSTDVYPTHRYAVDGDYKVTLAVTTIDGRTGSASQTVFVRTHDVSIIKFTVPNAASPGQTRHAVVEIKNNTAYGETVRVDFYKSVAGGYQLIGSLQQSVPARPSNNTVSFDFSYTFTTDDAVLGKVTFRAVATIVNARDALPADNQIIALPTKVNK